MTDAPPPTPTPQTPLPRGLWLLLLFPLAGVVLAALILTSGAPAPPPRDDAPRPTVTPRPLAADRAQVSFRAPAFTLPSLDGGNVRLQDYAGRLVFLNFWATWCIPCQREMPALEAFASAQPTGGPAVIAINVAENEAVIRDFLARYGGQTLTVLRDRADTVSVDYGVVNLPTTVVVDADGVIRTFKLGEITEADLAAYTAQFSPPPQRPGS